ncbi:keratinocyte differentiation-associated protein isoform X1 [Bos javanicus]|uniref:keratinocyte differentiation-associated protein isoform X1 n=1 Tax=Bos javanicus TaxID=9906 RepID=UPI002AA7F357|nr:keratinocyte differentiation-associated protein isoform X1 [Bos javanicus]
MKIPVLSAVVLLSVLALHSAQGAALPSSEEETTIGNYEAGPEAFNAQFLNIDKLRSAFKKDEFLNWHALFESIKQKLPFLNWDAFPKLKGLRSATPDAQ